MTRFERNNRKNTAKKICTALSAVSALTMLLAGCKAGSDPVSTWNGSAYTDPPAMTAGADTQQAVLDDPEQAAQNVEYSEFTIIDAEGKQLSGNGGVYTVTEAGEYILTGQLSEGSVTVDAPETAEVVLSLNGVSISCSTAAPIQILSADKVDIEAKSGTYNTVSDLRTGTDDGSEDNAAIISACDLKLKGKGTLIVSTGYSNGIKSRDDLEVKNLTLKVTARNHALKGNDAVEIESGNLILISTGGDGIKTSSSELSAKGKQKGSVIITGGHIDIYAACDGIDAAYNVEISETVSVTLNIFTSSYSEYAGSVNTGSDLYLIVPRSVYSDSSKYYAYFYNESDSDNGKWVECTFETMVYSGRTASYYGLSYKAPAGYSGVRYYILSSGTAPGSGEYTACTGGESLNTSMNAYMISKITSGSISGDWVQLSTGSGSNSRKTAYSSKAIKSANEILISGGALTLKCKDDALHANGGDRLESGVYGAGNIIISGGSLSIVSADDGMHADGELTINDGYINISEAHEGLEGNVVNINGGTVYVYGSDDGINACAGSKTPLVNITGGFLDVTTPSGDTDGIDSNGNITISGGYVLVKGGASSGGMAGSVDADGSVKMTGGAIVALGGICETPSNGSVNTYISSGASFSAGSYVLKDSDGTEILSFSLTANYSSCWIASSALAIGKTYTLYKDGSQVLSWSQDSAAVGSAGGWGGGGHGGPGGHGGFW